MEVVCKVVSKVVARVAILAVPTKSPEKFVESKVAVATLYLKEAWVPTACPVVVADAGTIVKNWVEVVCKVVSKVDDLVAVLAFPVKAPEKVVVVRVAVATL